jgi:hypothetical protein
MSGGGAEAGAGPAESLDYAKGMMSLTQTQPLAAIYEPEPTPETSVTTKADSSKVAAPSDSNIPDEMRKSSFAFLERQMGVWTLQDAQGVLGKPARARGAFSGNTIDGEIYAFPDATNAMREFELNFGKATGRLRAVYAYPYRATLQEAQALFGKNYTEIKNPNGTRLYLYKNRRLNVLADTHDAVISLGVYLP